MADDRLNRIRQISSRIPVLNEEASARLQAGQQLQLQQLAAATPARQLTTRAIQAIAPQATQQFGAQALQQQATAQQQQLGLAEQALKEQGAAQQTQLEQQQLAQQSAQKQAELAQGVELQRQEEAMKNRLTDTEIASQRRLSSLGIEADSNLSFLSLKQREDLSKLGRDVKGKLFDARIQFSKDEMGRKFNNERQMMDFAVSSAKSQIDLQSKLQTMEQVASRDIFMMEVAHNKIAQALENGYLDSKRELDQISRRRLAEMKANMEKEIARKKAAANNTKQVLGGVMVAAGAVMTAYGGGGGGAVGVPLMASGAGALTSQGAQ